MIDQRGLSKAERDFVPLTETGVCQAEEISMHPRIQNIELIVSSPFTRALQTASIISRKTGVPLQVEFDIYEWMPDLNGEIRTKDDLHEIHNDFTVCGGVYPDGESRIWETKASVIKRAESVLQKYVHLAEIAVVCHGMVISCLTDIFERLPYCGIYEIER